MYFFSEELCNVLAKKKSSILAFIDLDLVCLLFIVFKTGKSTFAFHLYLTSYFVLV